MRYWNKSSVYFLWFYSEGLAIQVNMLTTNIFSSYNKFCYEEDEQMSAEMIKL